MNELKFEVTQRPGEINLNCAALKEQLEAKMEEYKNKVFEEADKKEAKSDLAELRKLKKAVKDREREAKATYMLPMQPFEETVKEIISLIDEPIIYIDGTVKEFEDNRVRVRRSDIAASYDEIVPEELQDYIPLECIYGEKWNNAGTTIKSIRVEITDIADSTAHEISAIKTMKSDCVNEALNLYMSNRNLAATMEYISRYEATKEELRKKLEVEAEEKRERNQEFERERIRREERERVREEEKIRKDSESAAVMKIRSVDEAAAASLSSSGSRKVIYTVVATDKELEDIEMALTSLGVYFERKNV